MPEADEDFERRVRERAYHLWLDEGGPDGRDVEFWQRARLLEETGERTGEVSGQAGRPSGPIRERHVAAEVVEIPSTAPAPPVDRTAARAEAAANGSGLSIFAALAQSSRRGGGQA